MNPLFHAHCPQRGYLTKLCDHSYCSILSVAELRRSPDQVVAPFTHSHAAYEFLLPLAPMPIILQGTDVYFGRPGMVYPVQSGVRHGQALEQCDVANISLEVSPNFMVQRLREKGLDASAKKAGRIAAEGMSYALVENGVGALVEVNCETDFCAKSDLFVAFVKDIAKAVLDNDPADVDALMNCKYPGTELTVSETMPEKVMSIGENLQIRRFVRFAENTSVGYVHAGGKIGVLVNLAVEGVDASEIGKNVAMQIAALNPRFWDKSQVTEDVLAEEKKIALALMDSDPKMASKPAQVKEKIVMGKMNKFYEENCLLQMEFVRSDLFQGTVEHYIADAAKKLGGSVKFVTAVRFQTGEGIEKKQEDFAAEVAAQMNMGK